MSFEKQVWRVIENEAALRALELRDERLVVTQLCIGWQPVTYAVTVSSQGVPLQDHQKTYFDFGLTVENRSDVPMRIQFTIDRLDSDGIVAGKTPISGDIAPRERRRLWADQNLEDAVYLGWIALAEVAIGPTPTSPYEPTAWTAVTSPRRTIRDLFGLANNPAHLQRQGCMVILASIPLWLMLVLGIVML